jgi:hypothetical protein
MDARQLDSVGNIGGYALAAFALLSVVYRHCLLGPYRNILRWPYREMYKFVAASRRRDYLIRQAAIMVFAITAPWYLPIRVPIGMLAALAAGTLVSLHYLFTPPAVLFLSASFPGAEQSFDVIRTAMAPRRVVALLAERQIPVVRLSSSSWDNLRTLDETAWRDTVHRLMAMAQVVVIDLRVLTDNVRDEFMRLIESPYAAKALCVTDAATETLFRDIIHNCPQGSELQQADVETVIPAMRRRIAGRTKAG